MKRLTVCSLVLLASAVVAVSAAPAYAVDGVVLINQSTSVSGLPGCGSSGFPIVICQPGSYRLSSNLTLPSNTDGIHITVDNVTVDLNDFAILGAGGTNGVSGPNHVVIVNGTVKGMGQAGITLGNNSRIEKVLATSNGYDGIYCNGTCIVNENIAESNLHAGLDIGAGSTITGNVVHDNGIGILARDIGSTISGNTAYHNAGGFSRGIEVFCPSNVIGNTAVSNDQNLALFGSGCNLEHNLFP